MAGYSNMLIPRDGKYTSSNYLNDAGLGYTGIQGIFNRSGKDSRGQDSQYGLGSNTYYQYEENPGGIPGTKLYDDLRNPLYIETARSLGIKDFNSANDVARVVDYLSKPKTVAAPPAAPTAPAVETPPAATPAPPPEVAPGLPSLMVPGVDVRLLGQQIGVKPRRSKAQQEGTTKLGTSRLTIPRSGNLNTINLGV